MPNACKGTIHTVTLHYRVCVRLHCNMCKEIRVKLCNEQWYVHVEKLVGTSHEGE